MCFEEILGLFYKYLLGYIGHWYNFVDFSNAGPKISIDPLGF